LFKPLRKERAEALKDKSDRYVKNALKH